MRKQGVKNCGLKRRSGEATLGAVGLGVGVGDGWGVFLGLLLRGFFSWLWCRLWGFLALLFIAEHGEECGGEGTRLGEVVLSLVAEDGLSGSLSEVGGFLSS